jgi:hypothetical protein
MSPVSLDSNEKVTKVDLPESYRSIEQICFKRLCRFLTGFLYSLLKAKRMFSKDHVLPRFKNATLESITQSLVDAEMQ